MKPNALAAAGLLILVLVYFGNACSPSFKAAYTGASDVSALSCAQDESSMSQLAPQDLKMGYLNGRQVTYFNKTDKWIQVDGDMMYPVKGDLPTTPQPKGIANGVGVASSGTWPNGKIPFVVSPYLSNPQRVADAIVHWNTMLNGTINWVQRTNETDYVSFEEADSGCASPVGHFAGQGKHTVMLAENCGSGNVAHEMGHIVGLDHEQNRLDRDNYIAVNWSKIQSGYSNNFMLTSSEVDYGNYDFGSLMHYALNAFSVDGSNTMSPSVTVPAGVIVGQRQGLSAGDISSVKSMYSGSTNSTSSTSSSSNSTPSGTGLFARYYNGTDFSGNHLVKSQVDSTIDFDWEEAAPVPGVTPNNFSVRWDGWLVAPTTASYVFVVDGQDGYKVQINGTTMLDNLSGSGASESTSLAMNLVQGQMYGITVQMLADSNAASMHLNWRISGGPTMLVPMAVLIPNPGLPLSGSQCSQ